MSGLSRDSAWNRRVGGGETDAERADRNFMEMLPGLRITLTGSQILFAFLLVVPFSSDFARTTAPERAGYLATLVNPRLSAGLLVAPAAMHRVVFRRHLKDRLVQIGGALAIGGQSLFVLALAEASLLVGDYVYNLGVGVGIAALVVVWYALWFFLVPLRLRASDERVHAADSP